MTEQREPGSQVYERLMNVVREAEAAMNLLPAAAASAPTPAEPLDMERLAEAWGNVMDGRRVDGVRLHPGVTTDDDWQAIAAEYNRLAAARPDTPASAEQPGLREALERIATTEPATVQRLRDIASSALAASPSPEPEGIPSSDSEAWNEKDGHRAWLPEPEGK